MLRGGTLGNLRRSRKLAHLITSDVSGFRLLDCLAEYGEVDASCVLIPENRIASSKVAAVRAMAAERNIPISIHRRGSRFDDNLPKADIGVSWLYSQIIASEDLDRYRHGTLNMHGGLIPQYRGANVLQWAIINGEAEIGITWHEMVREVDAGTIWAESKVTITPDATAWAVRELMVEKGVELFPVAWRNMLERSGGRVPDLTGGRVWPVRRPEDGRIAPGLPERRLRDLVRALCPPWPPAFIEVNGERVGIAGVCAEPGAGAYLYVTSEGRRLHLRPIAGPGS